MDKERLIQQYLDHLNHADRLAAQTEEYKKAIVELLLSEGEVDDKGHQILAVGRYLLQRQRRESKPVLDVHKTEAWAKEIGIWESISKTVEVLDEDALFAYVFDHQELEDDLQSLFGSPKVSYALMRPTEVTNYEY